MLPTVCKKQRGHYLLNAYEYGILLNEAFTNANRFPPVSNVVPWEKVPIGNKKFLIRRPSFQITLP